MNTLLLFDGLDTGFGNEDRERERRKNAIEGLFTFMTDIGGRLKNFRFKIMLREDILSIYILYFLDVKRKK